jgi:UDP-N-acetylglucosamine--N-acetylmuramyl-(pentapeptide) pyrophosphoryl-undecaprenol N-acetylglucosamine transferase
MKIVLTGGGTAGHIFPLIAIVREIKKSCPPDSFQFFYIGPEDKFAKELLSGEGVEVKTISAGKIRRYFSFQNIIDLVFKLPLGFFQAFYYIFVISPDLIFSKGGYGSLPVVLAGWIMLTPIFIHESDVSPGLANKIASRFALEVFTAFPVEKTTYFSAKKMIAVGNPIREIILSVSEEKARETFGLKEEKPILFFIGGSQGAQKINNELLSALSDFLENFEIIHQTGKNNFEQVKREAKVVISEDLEKYYHPFPFLNEKEMTAALTAADLIVSRAGAGIIFEIAAVGKPSILVPLRNSAQDHQIKNAYVFAENGAAVVMEEANFRAHFLLERIKQLFSQPEKLKEMAEKAKDFSRPQAARVIARYIVEYLTQ